MVVTNVFEHNRSTNLTPGGSQNDRYGLNNSTSRHEGSDVVVVSAGANSMSYSGVLSITDWAIGAVSLKASVGAAANSAVHTNLGSNVNIRGLVNIGY